MRSNFIGMPILKHILSLFSFDTEKKKNEEDKKQIVKHKYLLTNRVLKAIWN